MDGFWSIKLDVRYSGVAGCIIWKEVYNPLSVEKIVDKRLGSNHLHQIIFCRKGS